MVTHLVWDQGLLAHAGSNPAARTEKSKEENALLLLKTFQNFLGIRITYYDNNLNFNYRE